MANCVDFEVEESLLQSMGTKMGVIIDRMPKCHCELAGEGMEYSWGCAKNEYRRKPFLIYLLNIQLRCIFLSLAKKVRTECVVQTHVVFCKMYFPHLRDISWMFN